MTVSTVSGTCSTWTSSPTTAPETSATAWMMSASMTSAIARVTRPVYGRTVGSATVTRSGRRHAREVRAGPVAAAHGPAGRALEPVVDPARPDPDLVGHLVREAHALVGDGVADRLAAGDLVDHLPQLLAGQQLPDPDVEELALEHARHHALHAGAVGDRAHER